MSRNQKRIRLNFMQKTQNLKKFALKNYENVRKKSFLDVSYYRSLAFPVYYQLETIVNSNPL